MVELNYVDAQQVPNFKDGANIRLSVIFNNNGDIVIDEHDKNIVDEIYNNSVTHNTLSSIHGVLTESMSQYNREVIATIFDNIVGYDYQTYYDIICIIRSIIEMCDNNEKVDFINQVMSIRGNKTEDTENTDETAEEAVEE